MTAGAGEVRVEVVGLFEQEVTLGEQEHHVPVVLLREPAGRDLRVPIGSCEALAIQIALEQHVVPRPLTHDLALRLLSTLSAKLDRIVVDDPAGDQPHATLYLRSSEGGIEMAARPGDAIAIALRADAPILVREDILGDATETP